MAESASAHLERIADKWTLMIVDVLANEPVRFNALVELVDGVSPRVLAVRLRALERDGLVTRTMSPAFPPRVSYELTSLGSTLIEPVRGLSRWLNDHVAEIDDARRAYDRHK